MGMEKYSSVIKKQPVQKHRKAVLTLAWHNFTTPDEICEIIHHYIEDLMKGSLINGSKNNETNQGK